MTPRERRILEYLGSDRKVVTCVVHEFEFEKLVDKGWIAPGSGFLTLEGLVALEEDDGQ
jgi:hypothetical protein